VDYPRAGAGSSLKLAEKSAMHVKNVEQACLAKLSGNLVKLTNYYHKGQCNAM
jgi:hypothetical protein